MTKQLNFASRWYGFGGLFLLLLGVTLIGWTQYLAPGIATMFVGFALMFTSGHYYFRKRESKSAPRNY